MSGGSLRWLPTSKTLLSMTTHGRHFFVVSDIQMTFQTGK